MKCCPALFPVVACLLSACASAPVVRGGIIEVPAGGDFQAALNDAAPGDTISLAAGATYRGRFVLPAKNGDQYITITSSAADKLPENARVHPSDSANMPKLVSPDNSAALYTEPAAHHYRIVGIEVRPAPGRYASTLVRLGSAEATSVDQLAHHIELDRVYIHGDVNVGSRRGVELNSGEAVIKNSYLSDIKGQGEDTQAICGWNGPGPYKILNNYIEGAGENVMFGGAAPAIDGLIPSDIEVRGNYFFKPTSWRPGSPDYAGKPWTVKNLFELKFARRVNIDGNIFENCWAQAQVGFAILFTVKSNDRPLPWVVIEDVKFTRNIIRHVASGINILGKEDGIGKTRNILIANNLFEDIGGKKYGGDGRLFQILAGPESVTIDHNTSLQQDMVIVADEGPSPGLVFTNNLFGGGPIKGSGAGEGAETLATYFPGAVFANNVLVDGASGSYPKGNYFPKSAKDLKIGPDYRLSDASSYRRKGSDGKDIGCDIAELTAATAMVKEGRVRPAAGS